MFSPKSSTLNQCQGSRLPVLLLPGHLGICRLWGVVGVQSCVQGKAKAMGIPFSLGESLCLLAEKAELWAREPESGYWLLSSDLEFDLFL